MKKTTRLALAVLLAGILPGCQSGSQVSPALKSSNSVASSQTASVTTPAPVIVPTTQTQLDEFAGALKVSYRLLTNNEKLLCESDTPPAPNADGSLPDLPPCHHAQLQLTPAFDFQGRDFTIYFSYIRPLLRSGNEEFSVTHINGDWHRLQPTEAFGGFKAGSTKTIDLYGSGLILSESDILPNFYVVAPDLQAVVIASTRSQIDPASGLESRPFVEDFTQPESLLRGPDDLTDLATPALIYDNSFTTNAPDLAVNNLIPSPKNVALNPGAPVNIERGLRLELNGFKREDVNAALDHLARLGVKESKDGLVLNINWRRQGDDELPGSYALDIDASSIVINTADAEGAANALHSIAGLLPANSSLLPRLHIEDSPRYQFRGMHLDVARNFHSKAMVLKLIDTMASYKLNKLHLHLADDEGWRLEIPDLPELTEVGAFRCHDPEENHCLLPQLGNGPSANSAVNGYFSRNDYLDILRAAKANHIEVIPSLDMPGHSRAAIKSMELRYRRYRDSDPAKARQYLLSDFADDTEYLSIQHYRDNTINACLESSYAFVEKVIEEVTAMHAEAELPLHTFHIGADETAGAWKNSPACQSVIAREARVDDVAGLNAYFIERVADYLGARGLRVGAWSDGLDHTRPRYMPERVQSNIWASSYGGANDVANRHANRGWRTVISLPDVSYFDFPYQADPKESGYYWAARAVDGHKIFSFMPDNLPALAEIWTDSQGRPFSVDDRPQASHLPLQKGRRFAGIQGQLWSEVVRSDDQAQYMIFPRLLVLAERAWHKAEWELAYDDAGAVYDQSSGHFSADHRTALEHDWQRFINVLGYKELPKLDRLGVFYRIPTVGAVIEEGLLKARVAYPGLAIEYRTDDSNVWLPYHQPVAVSTGVSLRARSADGQRSGRSIRINP